MISFFFPLILLTIVKKRNCSQCIGLKILLFVYFFLSLPVIAHSQNFHQKASAKSCIDFSFAEILLFFCVLYKSISFFNFPTSKTFSPSNGFFSCLKRRYFSFSSLIRFPFAIRVIICNTMNGITLLRDKILQASC